MERNERPDIVVKGVEYYHIPMIDEETISDSPKSVLGILQTNDMLISHGSMIKISASNKLPRKDMTPILCGNRPKISCIGKTLQRNPSALGKSGSHFRIEKFQNPQAVLCLMLRHFKLISLLSPGYDHQIIRDHLLHCFFCVFCGIVRMKGNEWRRNMRYGKIRVEDGNLIFFRHMIPQKTKFDNYWKKFIIKKDMPGLL